ncbi:MAG: hypothetical protein LH624_15700 [Cryobacterium sp.]|nr:hypothetical protein [Cryobacterium sp.]
MIIDETTGFLVDEFDRDALTAAIARTRIVSEADWQAMSMAASSYVVAERSKTTSVGALLEHYRSRTGSPR